MTIINYHNPIKKFPGTVFKSCLGMVISSEELMALMAIERTVSSKRAILPLEKFRIT